MCVKKLTFKGDISIEGKKYYCTYYECNNMGLDNVNSRKDSMSVVDEQALCKYTILHPISFEKEKYI